MRGKWRVLVLVRSISSREESLAVLALPGPVDAEAKVPRRLAVFARTVQGGTIDGDPLLIVLALLFSSLT